MNKQTIPEMVAYYRKLHETHAAQAAAENQRIIDAARAIADREAYETHIQQERGYVRRDNAERFVIVLPRQPRDIRWRITKYYVDRWVRALIRTGEKFEIYERAINDPKGDPYTWDLTACNRVYPCDIRGVVYTSTGVHSS